MKAKNAIDENERNRKPKFERTKNTSNQINGHDSIRKALEVDATNLAKRIDNQPKITKAYIMKFQMNVSTPSIHSLAHIAHPIRVLNLLRPKNHISNLLRTNKRNYDLCVCVDRSLQSIS